MRYIAAFILIFILIIPVLAENETPTETPTIEITIQQTPTETPTITDPLMDFLGDLFTEKKEDHKYKFSKDVKVKDHGTGITILADIEGETPEKLLVSLNPGESRKIEDGTITWIIRRAA